MINRVQGIHDCGELQANALQRSADEMTPGVMGPDSQKGTGKVRIPQRRALAEHVRQHQ